MDAPITLPTGGETISGSTPVVILGPNGSGKTRQSRNISAQIQVNFINALRNTRVPVELPAMGTTSARSSYDSHLSSARSNPAEMFPDFEFMLSNLLAQQSTAAMAFARRFERSPDSPGKPEVTPLTRVERIWGTIFPGRELEWEDWKPLITNTTGGPRVQYSGNSMSDGEKAALYLAGRVFDAPPGVLVVDEPETHLHTLLAARLWNTLEDERSDIRFVYVTHDLNFALSRRDATFVLASPTGGLRSIDISGRVPDDVAEALLGSASLSFYASRVVFCEGEESSLDGDLYRAWFNGPDTVVRSVGSCQRVLRCVDALRSSGITSSLEACGIVDRDNHSSAFIDGLPDGVQSIPVHEIESVYSLPKIVEAVSEHNAKSYDEKDYIDRIRRSVTDEQQQQIVVDRWKARLEPRLTALLSGVDRSMPVSEISLAIPETFNPDNWDFDPRAILEEEREFVSTAMKSDDIMLLLRVIPGKQVLSIAARASDSNQGAYIRLIVKSLSAVDPALSGLGQKIGAALAPHLPNRYAVAAVPTVAP